jgi:hypothetical protein
MSPKRHQRVGSTFELTRKSIRGDISNPIAGASPGCRVADKKTLSEDGYLAGGDANSLSSEPSPCYQ